MKEAIINMGIQSHKIMVTPIGIDTQQFKPTAVSDSFNRFNVSNNRILRIISTRNLAPVYDIDTLIKLSL